METYNNNSQCKNVIKMVTP